MDNDIDKASLNKLLVNVLSFVYLLILIIVVANFFVSDPDWITPAILGGTPIAVFIFIKVFNLIKKAIGFVVENFI